MKRISMLVISFFSIFFIINSSQAISLEFIKRGFKHCTGVCDKEDICGDQKKFDWCVKNCSHKMNPKHMCRREPAENIHKKVEEKISKEGLSEKEKKLQEQMMQKK